MELTPDTRNYLARKWITDCWGREPSTDEHRMTAERIRTVGLDLAYAAVYDDDRAKKLRAKRGW